MKWQWGKDTSNNLFEPKIAPDHPWHRPSMKKGVLTQSNHPVARNFAKIGQKMTFFTLFIEKNSLTTTVIYILGILWHQSTNRPWYLT